MAAGRCLWAPRPPLIFGLAIVVSPMAAWAAGLQPADLADLRRAYAASAVSSSEEPAVRAERATREPSTGFMLGAALGAWTAAREQLDFDLKNPAAAGAPHASQGAANLDAIDQDCREEKTAFDRLESRSRVSGLAPAEVLSAAGVMGPALVQSWLAREGGPAQACALP